MKLVKGLIIGEDDNVIMSKDTFYEMDNNFNITLKENKQLKEALLDIKEYIEEHTDKLKTTRVPKINFNYKELYDLVNKALGDKENE